MHLPAAAKGPIDADQAQGNIPLRLRKLVLLVRQGPFKEDHRREIDRSQPVLVIGDVHGSLGIPAASGQVRRPAAEPSGKRRDVFSLPSGLQHRLLVSKGQLLKAGVVDTDILLRMRP